jgi:hypothetical protein
MATHFKQSRTRAGAKSTDRPPRINPTQIRERFMKFFGAVEPDDRRDERWMEFAREAERGSEEEVLSRFQIVRQGYDCPAVDEYIAELEHELAEADRRFAELRGQAPAADEVNNELKRIGEQTSAVLIAAHEQSDKILCTAREEADRCVAEAAAKATTLAADTEAQLRELEVRKTATRHDRDRLFDDIRRVSAALVELIEGSHTAPPHQHLMSLLA